METTNATTHTSPNQNQQVEQQIEEAPTQIEIFSHGSCIGNPGSGGWGYNIHRSTREGTIIKRSEGKGQARQTTNIQTEITAACEALQKLGRVTDEPILVYSNLKLISDVMNERLAGWKANGWKKDNGKAVKNRDLWERLESAAAGRTIDWKWLPRDHSSAHSERAKQLATDAARRAEKRWAAR